MAKKKKLTQKELDRIHSLRKPNAGVHVNKKDKRKKNPYKQHE